MPVTVTSDSTYDDDIDDQLKGEGDPTCSTTFTVETGEGVRSRITICVDAYTIENARSKWIKLHNAAKNHGHYKIVTCMSNGEVSIEIDDETIDFHTSKYGAGGDGEITVTLPCDSVISAIENIIAHYDVLLSKK